MSDPNQIHDLAEIWQRHTMAEFAFRDADAAVSTLTDDAHVLLLPVLTGAVGKPAVREFYAGTFLAQLPPDIEAIPVSRTVGQDRLVDEAVYRFTHTLQMDWFLPGVPATGKRLEFPIVGIIQFRGGLISHEHLIWDHAGVLAQLGLLDASKIGGGVQGNAPAHRLLELCLPAEAESPAG